MASSTISFNSSALIGHFAATSSTILRLFSSSNVYPLMASIMVCTASISSLLGWAFRKTASKDTLFFMQYSMMSAYGMLLRWRQLLTVDRALPSTVPNSVSENAMPSMAAILCSMSSKFRSNFFIIKGCNMRRDVALCDCINLIHYETITNAQHSVMNIRTYQQNAPLIISRLREVEGAQDDKALELALISKGYGKRNLVVNWIKRNKISSSFLETYTENEGVSLDWLVHGRGSRFAAENKKL